MGTFSCRANASTILAHLRRPGQDMTPAIIERLYRTPNLEMNVESHRRREALDQKRGRVATGRPPPARRSRP